MNELYRPLMGSGLFERDFTPLKFLGGGAFGQVFSVKKKTTDEKAVAKFINRKLAEEVCENEIEIMKFIQHRNVVELMEVYENKSYQIIVMKQHGVCSMNVQKYTQHMGGHLSEHAVKLIARQMTFGVKYLHDKQIAHFDLKDENLIINENLEVKIIDFGLAGLALENNTPYHGLYGDVKYQAPEMDKGLPYHGKEVDMWAFGCVLYKLFNGVMPFPINKEYRLVYPDFIPRSSGRIPCAKLPKVKFPASARFKHLIVRMLEKTIAKRFKIDDVLIHPWFNDMYKLVINKSHLAPFSASSPPPTN